MPTTKISEREQALKATAPGRALLALIAEFPSKVEMSRALDIEPTLIQRWLTLGRVSRDGAKLIEQRLGVTKEKMRPDLDARSWEEKPRGPRIGAKADRDGADQRILAALSKHFGSVRKLCDALGIKIGDYHKWMSRNRIAAWAVPRICALDIPDGILGLLIGEDKKQ